MTYLFQWLFGVGLLVSFSAHATTQVIPSEYFSRLPMFEQADLSPSGAQLAFVYNDRNSEVSVLTAYTLGSSDMRPLLQFDNQGVRLNWYRWANEKTVLVSVRYPGKRDATKTTETRLLAIDVDEPAPEARVLIRPRSAYSDAKVFSQFQDNVIDILPDDPEHIVIAVDLDVKHSPSVYRLNIYTKKLKRLEKGKRKIRDWLMDQQNNLRIGLSKNYDTGENVAFIRKHQSDTWHRYFEYNAFEDAPVYPVGFGNDPNIVYFKRYENDKLALFSLNLTDNTQRLVFSDPHHDVDGALLRSNISKDIVGIMHRNSETGRVYWDKEMAMFQKRLNVSIEHKTNVLIDMSDDENVYLVHSENDSHPGTYYLGNKKRNSLTVLFSDYPELVNQILPGHQSVEFTARDGIKIEAYLTLPLVGEKPFPTVIHPHGGPAARDSSGFDPWTSFFVSRGYAVLRPNFRGSVGFGFEFAQQQMQGWGLAMQDDLEDGTQWMIDKGHAQRDKICIVGGSYGGYAAMMGAAKTPFRYACAISIAGVSDLKKLVWTSKRFVNNEMVKRQIGEDSDDLASRSPRFLAKNIQAPILLIHGEKDRVVDVRQSQTMADALDDLNKNYQYIELPNGDHYLSNQVNRHSVFSAMEEFLAQHLK